MKEKDLYELLGISKKANKRDIKKAYREKAKIHHPDHKGDSDEFVEIVLAYSVLIDDNKRAYYDQTGKTDVNTQDKIKRTVYDRLCQLFSVIVDKRKDQIFSTDIIGVLRKSISNHIKQGKKSLNDFEEERKYLEKIKRRIKCKKNKANIFGVVIEDKLKNCNFVISQGKFDLKVFAEMDLLLNDFEFDYDKIDLYKTHQQSILTKIDFSWWGG